MINEPVFNFKYISDPESAPHNGTPVQLMYIKDIKPREGMMMYSQMCDAGYRMGKDQEDYSKWNQCVFEDIDYKFYIENHEEFIDPIIIYEQLYGWLYNNYKNILYYTELSRTNRGYHIIFYFNVQRNKNNRMMCKALADFIINRAFNELGYSDIINWPKVFDDCADSFYQACFFTLNNYKINNECDGMKSEEYIMENYYSVKNIYDKLFSKSHHIKSKKINNKNILDDDYNNKWDIEFIYDETIKYNGEYMNHHERYYLFRSIVGMCGGTNEEELIKEEWENCARQLIEGNKHDYYFYSREPYVNNWIDWINKNETYCYIDDELMKQFGYSIKYINNKKDEDIVKQKTKKVTTKRVYLS